MGILPKRVDGHADPGGGEDVEVDLQLGEGAEEVEGVEGGVGQAVRGALPAGRALFELLAQVHDLFLDAHGGLLQAAVDETGNWDPCLVMVGKLRTERSCTVGKRWSRVTSRYDGF